MQTHHLASELAARTRHFGGMRGPLLVIIAVVVIAIVVIIVLAIRRRRRRTEMDTGLDEALEAARRKDTGDDGPTS